MKAVFKILIIIASLFIISGIIVFAIVVANGGEVMAKYATKTYTNLEDFNDIYINTNTADINFLKSTEGKAKVVCFENKKTPHNVEVKDGKLTIEVQDNRKWYDYINISSKSPSITIYLPVGSKQFS